MDKTLQEIYALNKAQMEECAQHVMPGGGTRGGHNKRGIDMSVICNRMMLAIVLTVVTGLLAGACRAAVVLPSILGHNMVLQQNQPLPVWGWADPGEEVTVAISDITAAGKADAYGRWQVRLPPLAAVSNALEMIVKGSSGSKLVVTNILVGEVWLGSGQSNMEMNMLSTRRAKEFIDAADRPQMRLFLVWRDRSPLPKMDCNAKWVVCSPAAVRSFSAAMYHFGRVLQDELHMPVGLIQSAYSGTSIHYWTPPDPVSTNSAERTPAERKLAHLPDKMEIWVRQTRKALAAGGMIQQPPCSAGVGRHKGNLYNAHIYPLIPFAIRGVLWYQGESQVAGVTGLSYYESMKELIEGWRHNWGQGDFPFYFVQLAPRDYSGYTTNLWKLPLLWENQVAALAITNTGMAGTMDISPVEEGDPTQAHPKNKLDVGKRLALLALKRTYGKKDVVDSGPMYVSHAIEGSKARVQFANAASGLATRDGKPVTWFQLAGENQKYLDATAAIEGDTVVVSCPQIKKPVALRYGWYPTATPNLMNKEGLPAIPFRTDRW